MNQPQGPWFTRSQAASAPVWSSQAHCTPWQGCASFRAGACPSLLGISHSRGALLERPAGGAILTAPLQSPGCSKADVPSEPPKKPKNVSEHERAGASLQQELVPLHRPAALPWRSFSRLGAGWWCRGMEERTASEHSPHTLHQREKNPLLVCVPADSRRVLHLCLSCYLCLPFAPSSCSRWKHSQPPESQDTSQTLPRQAGNAGALAGSSSISRASRNVLPGEPPCASSLILYS